MKDQKIGTCAATNQAIDTKPPTDQIAENKKDKMNKMIDLEKKIEDGYKENKENAEEELFNAEKYIYIK
ncbi:MAG: hypothetical protein HXX11_23165 [Desulfuromonadales bacterium]|nr:hypothetical protein [Desulfuromonadales bacterium]